MRKEISTLCEEMGRGKEILVIVNASKGILVIPSINGPKTYLADQVAV